LLLLQVISCVQPFSSYKNDQGLQLLGVLDSQMFENDEVFPCEPLDSKAALSEALKSCMSCDTVGELMLHMGRDLALRCLEGHPGEHGKEATMRELISPIIFAAAALTEDIRVLAEYGVHGTRASGSIDWVLLFKRFSIVIVEVVKHLRAIIVTFLAYCIARGSLSIQRLTRSCPCIQHLKAKLHDKVEDHLGQLAAEMHSAREEYSISQLGKRKHEEPPELQQVRLQFSCEHSLYSAANAYTATLRASTGALLWHII
jgi:hypothetical protein